MRTVYVLFNFEVLRELAVLNGGPDPGHAMIVHRPFETLRPFQLHNPLGFFNGPHFAKP